MVKFRCLMEGLCCKKYWIPVTHLDLYRLHLYGSIEVERLYRYTDLYPSKDMGDAKFTSIRFCGEDFYLALKSTEDGCIFLSRDGKCSVHGFKPLVCRFYPFVYIAREDGEILVDVNDRAIEECPGLQIDDNTIPYEIESSIKQLARARLKEIELWNRVAAEFSKMYGDRCDKKYLIRFLIQKAQEDYLRLREEGLWIT